MKISVRYIRLFILTVLTILGGVRLAYAQDPDPYAQPLLNDSVVDAQILVKTPIDAEMTEEVGHTGVVGDDYPYGF